MKISVYLQVALVLTIGNLHAAHTTKIPVPKFKEARKICPTCGKEISRSNFQKHMKIHTNTHTNEETYAMTCTVCKENPLKKLMWHFVSLNDLQKHNKDIHDNALRFMINHGIYTLITPNTKQLNPRKDRADTQIKRPKIDTTSFLDDLNIHEVNGLINPAVLAAIFDKKQ